MAIITALGGPQRAELSKANAMLLIGIAYFQPITRSELSELFGREITRDVIGALPTEGLIAAGLHRAGLTNRQ